jgi:alpha-tubulin suppressor-like RCC1 family protein
MATIPMSNDKPIHQNETSFLPLRYALSDLNLMSDDELQELAYSLGFTLPFWPNREKIISIIDYLGLIDYDERPDNKLKRIRDTIEEEQEKTKKPRLLSSDQPHAFDSVESKARMPSNEGIQLISIAAGQSHSLILDEQGRVGRFGSDYSMTPEPKEEEPKTITWLQETKPAFKIVCGGFHSLALAAISPEKSQVIAFGLNNSGQLGLGHEKEVLVPTPIENLEDIIDLAAGDGHSLFLNSKGQVLTCGSNHWGQLGIESTIPLISQPKLLGQEVIRYPVMALAAGGRHSLFLTTQGRVYSCGSNQYGQLGISTKRPISKQDQLALRGEFSRHQPALIQFTRKHPIVDVTAGGDHSLLLSARGQVYALGANNWGQLGLGDLHRRTYPTRIEELPEIRAMSAGRDHSLLLSVDGRVFAFGSNQNGQIGLGDIIYHNFPYLLPVIEIMEIAAGGQHSLLLDSQGQLLGLGSNNDGQLNLGEVEKTSDPVVISGLMV